jgi:RNA polymerase sporulation-specific sigma factor
MVEKIALRQAIDGLPERERMVIQLRYFHSLTQQRVAKVLNVSQVQVSRIEKRAIVMLRERME